MREEIDARFGVPRPRGAILEWQIVPLRRAVYAPMQCGRLYLLGDVTHIVPPMSEKGIHLALHDAEVLAPAIVKLFQDNVSGGLEAYAETALGNIWNYQAFAAWSTQINHDAGDATYAGDFRKQIARAELRRLFDSPTANQLHSEFLAGIN